MHKNKKIRETEFRFADYVEEIFAFPKVSDYSAATSSVATASSVAASASAFARASAAFLMILLHVPTGRISPTS